MRYLTIEWLKLKRYKVFWILSILYVVSIVIAGLSGMLFLEFMKSDQFQIQGIDPSLFPIYNFPDVWQTIGYAATYFNVFPAFIVVISMTNEYTYRTFRQNIIDGMSRTHFLLSKLSLVIAMAVVGMVVAFVVAMCCGFSYASDTSFSMVVKDMYFIPVLGLTIFLYSSLALLVSVLLKRSGFTIVLLLMYTLIFEPFIVFNFNHNPFLPEGMKKFGGIMPVEVINNLIHMPFKKYMMQGAAEMLTFGDVALAMGWGIIYWMLIYWVVNRKNL